MVECKVCGKNYKLLASHLTRTHKITKEEYLERYPGSELVSKEVSNQRSKQLSDRNKSNWSDSEYRDKMTNVLTKNVHEQWRDPEFVEMRSNWAQSHMIRMNEDPDFIKKVEVGTAKYWGDEDNFRYRSELMTKFNKENWKCSTYKESMSNNMKKLWEDESYRSMMTETARNTMNELWTDSDFIRMRSNEGVRQMKANWSNPKFRSMMHDVAIKNLKSRRMYSHNDISFRSSWEYRFALYLEEYNIKYQYEYESFEYVDEDGVLRRYYPDFYLRDLDTYVEIHPTRFMDNNMYLKLESVPNIVLLTEIELSAMGIL